MTLPKAEIIQRIKKLAEENKAIAPHARKDHAHRLNVQDIADYLKVSRSTIVHTVEGKREMTNDEQFHMSLLLEGIADGTLVKKKINDRWVVVRGKPAVPSKTTPSETAFGFEFTPGGPKLKRLPPTS